MSFLVDDESLQEIDLSDIKKIENIGDSFLQGC